eukprot:scaffold19949_cov45-Attheya_sp.AAC.1
MMLKSAATFGKILDPLMNGLNRIATKDLANCGDRRLHIATRDLASVGNLLVRFKSITEDTTAAACTSTSGTCVPIIITVDVWVFEEDGSSRRMLEELSDSILNRILEAIMNAVSSMQGLVDVLRLEPGTNPSALTANNGDGGLTPAGASAVAFATIGIVILGLILLRKRKTRQTSYETCSDDEGSVCGDGLKQTYTLHSDATSINSSEKSNMFGDEVGDGLEDTFDASLDEENAEEFADDDFVLMDPFQKKRLEKSSSSRTQVYEQHFEQPDDDDMSTYNLGHDVHSCKADKCEICMNLKKDAIRGPMFTHMNGPNLSLNPVVDQENPEHFIDDTLDF